MKKPIWGIHEGVNTEARRSGSRTCYVSVDDYEASCEAQQWRILSPNEILCDPASGSTMLSSKTIQGKSRAAH